ncbi:MAG: hypothetical protein JWN61_1552 [Pseudonocardiales bacterium]|nr:hypothetical protein [Pseudonocardiales bacterium]
MTFDASRETAPPADDLAAAQAEYDRLAGELEALRSAGHAGTEQDRSPEEAREHEVNVQRLVGDALRRLDAARRDAGQDPVDRDDAPISGRDARSDLSAESTE